MTNPDGPPMPNPRNKTPRKIPQGYRAFKGTFFVLVNENEDDDESPTREEIIDALQEMLVLDLDTEECPNPGVQDVTLHFNTLTELTPDEMGLYYGK